MGRCGQEPRTATGRSLLPPPQWAPQAGFGESRVDSPPETTLGDCPCFPRPCRETRANRRSLGLGPTEKAPGRLGAVRGAEAQPGPGRQGALVACRGQGPWEGTIRHAQVVGWNGVQTPHPPRPRSAIHMPSLSQGLTQGHLLATLWQLATPRGQGSKAETKSPQNRNQERTEKGSDGQGGWGVAEGGSSCPRRPAPSHLCPAHLQTGASGSRGP